VVDVHPRLNDWGRSISYGAPVVDVYPWLNDWGRSSLRVLPGKSDTTGLIAFTEVVPPGMSLGCNIVFDTGITELFLAPLVLNHGLEFSLETGNVRSFEIHVPDEVGE